MQELCVESLIVQGRIIGGNSVFTVLPNSSNWYLTTKEAVFLGILEAALKLYTAEVNVLAIFYDKRKKIVLFILMNYKCN